MKDVACFVLMSEPSRHVAYKSHNMSKQSLLSSV